MSSNRWVDNSEWLERLQKTYRDDFRDSLMGDWGAAATTSTIPTPSLDELKRQIEIAEVEIRKSEAENPRQTTVERLMNYQMPRPTPDVDVEYFQRRLMDSLRNNVGMPYSMGWDKAEEPKKEADLPDELFDMDK